MRKTGIILILCLAALLILTGCSLAQALLDTASVVPYEDMEYTRPDMTELQQALANAQDAARGDDLEQIVDGIYAFYDVYDRFYTDYALADICYSGDLTDIYWEAEYNFCAENSAAAETALEELYYALAQSPCRSQLESDEYFGAGFFDSYEGENLWDDTFTALLEEESGLISQYYELSEAALEYESGTEDYYDACAEEMAALLAELVKNRQEQAAWWSYGNYSQFASDFYYYRDYTTAQTDAYLEAIRQELTDLYRQVNQTDIWEATSAPCTEDETFDYVRTAAKNMGGTVEDAFDLLDTAGLYDISYGENKYNSSFEIYLTSYWEPFIFMNPTLSSYDRLTFAHEFGHFCNDYASYGSYAGIDVMEIFSQGMEYLSLCYAEDSEDLTRLKMADTLCLFVEQAAFASFEQQLYTLPADQLNADGIIALYDGIALSYGFDAVEYDPREFVTITHFYTNPMYIVSYVVSCDAALQLYQMELEESGTGLRCFEENLTTESYSLMEFLASAGLESPFAEGRLPEIRRTLENALN